MYRQIDKFMKKNKSKNLSLDENEIDSIQDLIKEAVSYQENTPASFKKLINKLLILGSNSSSYLNTLSSPILNISKKELQKPLPNYIIIDTRPYEIYSKGHFSQSFNLSSELPITTGKFLFRLEEL